MYPHHQFNSCFTISLYIDLFFLSPLWELVLCCHSLHTTLACRYACARGLSRLFDFHGCLMSHFPGGTPYCMTSSTSCFSKHVQTCQRGIPEYDIQFSEKSRNVIMFLYHIQKNRFCFINYNRRHI